MKILVGLDGTERSYHALEYVSGMLSPTEDRISLYFSPPKLSLKSHSEISACLPATAYDAMVETVFNNAKSKLATEFEPHVNTIVGHNKPCEGILAAAEQEDTDLIVIGAHSATRRPPLFLGGSARRIAHHSETPVLLVREKQDASKNGLKVLVCCSDDDELWRNAAESLRQFTWPENSEATLYQVVETLDESYVENLDENVPATVPGRPSLIEEYRSCISVQENAKTEQLRSGLSDLPPIFHGIDPKVGHGHVVSAIVDEVQENNVDLVVVGARRLGRLGRLLGSTTEGLLTQCPCSVLVVHDKPKP